MSVPKSVVLITVDCLRADRVGFMGYGKPTTPFLDSLATESFVFPKAIVAGAPTYYSFPGILASRFPLVLGRDVIGISPGEPTLASVLQNRGYRTAAFVAANPYLSSRFGYHQGFESFDDFLSEGMSKCSGGATVASGGRSARTRVNETIARLAHALGPLGRLYDDVYFEYCQRIAARSTDSWDSLRRFPAADVLVSRACEWLESISQQPFFLWLHLMDPHAPYYPPAEALAALGSNMPPGHGRYVNAAWNRGDLTADRLRKYRDQVVLLQDAGIRWVDTHLARVAEFLRRLSRWESTLLVVTADHGEEFLDHRDRFHSPARAYQELLHVPLLLRMPGVEKVQVANAPFSQIHLAPTILEALGIDSPAEFEGRSHWPEIQRGDGWELAISESVGACTNPMDTQKRLGGRVLAVQDEKYKLTVDFDSREENLFDLEQDSGEARPLARDAEKRVRARFLRAALEHLNRPGRQAKHAALGARIHEIKLELNVPKQRSESQAS